MTNAGKLSSYARDFEFASLLTKISFIKKLPNGKWTVLSEKGKHMGTYDTKEQAVDRLRAIEYFKAHKKKAAKEDSYSSIMRALNKADDKEAMTKFQTTFKEMFDKSVLKGEENPEQIALENALDAIDSGKETLEKAASAINLGDPESAGQYLAQLLRFILRRISPERRQKAIETLKRKVYYLNEYGIAQKRTPASASLGNSITLLKTLLLEHKPEYIRATLNAIVRYL
jgi:hypothetical protein